MTGLGIGTGEEVAVYIAGLALPLYGVVKLVSGDRITVDIQNKRGSVTMTVDADIVKRWRRGRRYG